MIATIFKFCLLAAALAGFVFACFTPYLLSDDQFKILAQHDLSAALAYGLLFIAIPATAAGYALRK